MGAGESKGRDLGCEKLEAWRPVLWMWTETKTSEEWLLPGGDAALGAGSDWQKWDVLYARATAGACSFLCGGSVQLAQKSSELESSATV